MQDWDVCEKGKNHIAIIDIQEQAKERTLKRVSRISEAVDLCVSQCLRYVSADESLTIILSRNSCEYSCSFVGHARHSKKKELMDMHLMQKRADGHALVLKKDRLNIVLGM